MTYPPDPETYIVNRLRGEQQQAWPFYGPLPTLMPPQPARPLYDKICGG